MTQLKRSFASLACLALFVQSAVAQESESVESESAETESDGTQSGYNNLGKFGGPEDVGARLEEIDKERESTYDFDNLQRGSMRFRFKRSRKVLSTARLF